MCAEVFILFYVAHLLSDYAFQMDRQSERKALPSAAGWRALLSHAGTHVVVSALLLGAGSVLLDLPPGLPAAITDWVGLSHGVIDRRWPVQWWMEHTGSSGFFEKGGAPLVDLLCTIKARETPSHFCADRLRSKDFRSAP
ncbi:DUF3307 domain-containing protein [Streptomyces sp. NPDC051555]|uniref:DUF3307 domain-containing protein n=1 Tax=Streptomyces sp. NPDC051555 TaxID=3365657 RepID=UPI0037A33F1C